MTVSSSSRSLLAMAIAHETGIASSSPEVYIRSTEGVRRPWLLPWYYVRRPLRFLARRGRAILSRPNRSDTPARTRPDAG